MACKLEAVECNNIMNRYLPIHLMLYVYVITKVLQGAQNTSRNPLICTAAVVETGVPAPQDNDIVLLSYGPR